MSKQGNGSNHKVNDEPKGIVMEKSIGIPQGISIVVGIIIGSGIFVSPIGVLKYTKSVGVSFIMWVVCGIFSTLGAIVYAELGVTIPRSGGEYIYILKSFGPLAAFVCMWITFITVGAVSLAANSLIFAQYIMRPVFANCSVPSAALMLFGLLGIVFLAAMNCYNVKLVTRISIFFTVCKVAALLVIVGIGFYYLYKGNVSSFTDAFDSSDISFGSLSLAFYQGFWAYAGWNYLNFLIDEMDNPSKNLPITIITSLVIVTVVYVTVNVAYLAVLSPVEMLDMGSESIAVAVVYADKTMSYFAILMPIFVGASVFGSMNGEFLSVSRLTFTAAKEGHMPKLLGMVSYKYLTPIPSVILLTLLAVIFIFSPNVFYLIELSGFAFCVVAAMAVSCLLYLRWKCPELPRPFKLPIIIPIIFLLLDVFIGILTVIQSPREALISILIMVAAIPVYVIFVVWKSKPKGFKNATHTLTIFAQKLMLVVPENEE